MMEGFEVTAFGEWNIYDDEKTEAEFVRARFFVGDGEDLFEVLASPAYSKHRPKRSSMGEKRSGGVEGEWQKKKKKKQQMYYYEERINIRKAKAVDEDLYKIPNSELLFHQIPKKKKRLLVSKFWAGCLCLNCIE